jgi:HlyD family secretion protein
MQGETTQQPGATLTTPGGPPLAPRPTQPPPDTTPPPRRGLRLALGIVVLLLLAAAIVGAYFLLHRQPPPAGYIKANGTLEATEVDVSAKVTGHILTLTVDEGSPVREGQIIATLDGAELQAQVNQAQGAYA